MCLCGRLISGNEKATSIELADLDSTISRLPFVTVQCWSITLYWKNCCPWCSQIFPEPLAQVVSCPVPVAHKLISAHQVIAFPYLKTRDHTGQSILEAWPFLALSPAYTVTAAWSHLVPEDLACALKQSATWCCDCSLQHQDRCIYYLAAWYLT
jgi:hypothetical protein